MRLFIVLILGLAAAVPAIAQDQGQGALHLLRAKLVLKKSKADKPPSHAFKLKGTFLPGDLTLPVNPARDDIRLYVEGIEVFRLPPAAERDGLRFRSHGRWRYRQKSVRAGLADRLKLDLPRGRIEVKVNHRDLTAVLNHGPRALNVALEMNGQLIDVSTDFSTSGRRWTVRNRNLVLPPGGAGSLPPNTAPRDDNGRITAVILDAGEISKRALAFQVDARDEAQMRLLWAQHKDTQPPYVDFSREMVVAVFLGTRPTGGYAVVIESITRTGTDLDVLSSEGRPGAGCIVSQALTTPYVLVRVPRVTGVVRHDQRFKVYTCSPR